MCLSLRARSRYLHRRVQRNDQLSYTEIGEGSTGLHVRVSESSKFVGIPDRRSTSGQSHLSAGHVGITLGWAAALPLTNRNHCPLRISDAARPGRFNTPTFAVSWVAAAAAGSVFVAGEARP